MMPLACTKMSAPPSSGLMNPNPRCSSQAQRSLSIPWQKPPSKRSRQILLPHNASRSDVRPEQFERRAAPGQRNRPRSSVASDCPDDQSLSIPWQKPPSKRSREILLPHNASRSKVRPQQFERLAGLVSAIARGRRWLDDVVSGRVTTVAQLCTREKCSVRQVNMTISLAFLAPNLVKAAVEGRLPRGIGIERLRDPPTEWGRQFDALGLNPE